MPCFEWPISVAERFPVEFVAIVNVCGNYPGGKRCPNTMGWKRLESSVRGITDELIKKCVRIGVTEIVIDGDDMRPAGERAVLRSPKRTFVEKSSELADSDLEDVPF